MKAETRMRRLGDSAKRLHMLVGIGASRAAMVERAHARCLLADMARDHGHLALQMGAAHFVWTLDIEDAKALTAEVEAWQSESQAA